MSTTLEMSPFMLLIIHKFAKIEYHLTLQALQSAKNNFMELECIRMRRNQVTLPPIMWILPLIVL